MHWIVYSFLLSVLVSCTSALKPESSREAMPLPTGPVKEGSVVDYVGLQRSLGLEIPVENLGYQEKSFDTCQAGYGYSGTHNCRREYMVVINFQLQCRDSEGQVSVGVNNADLTPIANRDVHWNLKNARGVAQTNSDGFAQIMTVSRGSQRQQRLKLAVGNDFLYMRANEITRVVTPRPWCL